jgi:hypothetical protein
VPPVVQVFQCVIEGEAHGHECSGRRYPLRDPQQTTRHCASLMIWVLNCLFYDLNCVDVAKVQ